MAVDLLAQGFSVFTELGDNCKADLVIVDQVTYDTYKVQVKYRQAKGGVVKVENRKSGPNYKFSYKTVHADIYAVFVPEWDRICYISSNQFLRNLSQLTIRIDPCKNGQKAGCHYVEDYHDVRRALRDCTQDTLPDNAEGEGAVQTTTAA